MEPGVRNVEEPVQTGNTGRAWKYGFGLVVVLMLLGLGIRGRNESVREAAFREIGAVRDQVQRALNATWVWGGGQTATRPTALAGELDGLLFRFERNFKGVTLNPAEDFRLRLARATALNAGANYDLALASLTERDEASGSPAEATGRGVDVLEVRADAQLGLHRWKEAAERYRQVLARQPERLSAWLKLTECQSRLGDSAGATASLYELLRVLNQQANLSLDRGRLSAAVPELEAVLEVQRRLLAGDAPATLARDHVGSLVSLAWIHAARPEPELRDAAKAKALARKAGEISNWLSYRALEALAAGHAEAREFAEASQWQEKALALAPVQSQEAVRSRLRQYERARDGSHPLPTRN